MLIDITNEASIRTSKLDRPIRIDAFLAGATALSWNIQSAEPQPTDMMIHPMIYASWDAVRLLEGYQLDYCGGSWVVRPRKGQKTCVCGKTEACS